MKISQITRLAVFCAILYISKVVLEAVPNVELVSLLIICYSIVFGYEAIVAILVFNLCELEQWGMGPWWMSYLYVWPILAILTCLLKKIFKEDILSWAVFSGLFGLFFGAMFSIVYIFVDPHYALAYFLSGLIWDVVHCVSNFIIMLLLGKILIKALKKIKELYD